MEVMATYTGLQQYSKIVQSGRPCFAPCRVLQLAHKPAMKCLVSFPDYGTRLQYCLHYITTNQPDSAM